MKCALVTGGTKGIGRAIVERLLKENYYVLINYAHDKVAADSMSEEIKAEYGGKYDFIQADLSDIASVETVVCAVKEKCTEIDALVLNAGITDYASFGSITWDSWNHVINTNLSIPLFLIQELRDVIREDGSIVLIASNLGHYPHGRSVSYGISKAGVAYLAQVLVKEFADKRVRVNAVSPGFTDTEWHKTKTPEHKKRITDKVALHRFGEPGEIADMVYSVINNTYINGANVEVDGGYSYF